MNTDILRFKFHFVSIALLLGYAFLHVKMTGVYVDSDLQQLINLTARLPYGQRLLVPTLAHAIQYFLPLRTADVFFLLEWGFISAFFLMLYTLLKTHFEPSPAQLLSWLFILLLPLVTVVNYRFTTNGPATFFYPYDSATLFFIAGGFLWCLQQRWAIFIPWVFLATLNRESSILLVLLIPALNWQQRGRFLLPLVGSFLAFGLARLTVLYSVKGLPGTLAEWCYLKKSIPHFSQNLWWLLDFHHVLLLAFCFAGLPLFWFAFYDYIPARFHPLRYLTFGYFVGLLFLGNFPEVRIFNEIVLLLYLPVCIGISQWLKGQTPAQIVHDFSDYVDRFAILIGMGILVAFHHPLSQLAERWLHCS